MNGNLYFTYYALILVFGIILSFLFAGIRLSRKLIISEIAIFIGSGLIQILTFMWLGVDATWKLYPFIAHLPIVLVMHFVFKKRLSTILAAVSLAYLCCQPSKWFGILVETVSKSEDAGYIVRIIVLVLAGVVAVYILSPYVSRIYNKDTKSILVFGGIPIVYYIFDYVTAVYTNLWLHSSRVTMEFMPFLLCVLVMMFYSVYYREYERKTDAEHKEHIVQITMRQQSKELEAIKNSNSETRILRHDMKHLLNNIALSIEEDDKETAKKLISGYISKIENASFRRYCEEDTLNYVIANCESACRENAINFTAQINIQELKVDASLLATIVSNALDNAVNANKDLPENKRQIRLVIKSAEDKLLLSIKNPYKRVPMFIEGLPVTENREHGYGTQSIKYMTEQLGGKYQFTTEDNYFVLRIIFLNT